MLKDIAGSVIHTEFRGGEGAPDKALAKWDNPSLISHLRSAPRLVNLERAYAHMERYNLEGIVASSPVNIHYLSSHSGITQWMGRPFTTYAFLPRLESAPAALIMPRFTLYHLDYKPTWMPSVQSYSSPLTDAAGDILFDENGDPQADQNPCIWPQREESFNDRDKLLMAIFAAFEGKQTATPIYALKAALQDAGIVKGRVGFEDPRDGAFLREAGLTGIETVDATTILQEIRMVKTEPEIALLRQAAQKNETALDHAIKQIEPGLPLIEVEKAHARKWGELDGIAKWCIVNVNGLNSGTFRMGDFLKLDSVGAYQGYHGDVGRTVSIGQPSDELAGRIAANTKCSRVVYDAIHPGMKFTEASAMFADLMKQEGFTAISAPHCVGLEHTDQPFYGTGALPTRYGQDFVFEKGTVFTLDMPYNEIGWGTSHVEDMMLVLEQGCEGLSSMDTSLQVVCT